MHKIGCHGLAGILLLPGAMAGAVDGYSDPLRPPAAIADHGTSKVSLFGIPARLGEIEEEIDEETRVLAALAPLQVGIQFDEFGYHSDYIPAVDGISAEPLWTLDFGAGLFPTQAMVLVPALDQRSSDLRGYAFPKRFRIRSVDEQGVAGGVLVDWTTQDFPDPGLRPVYFSFPEDDEPMGGLRLEIFAGHEEKALEFFALGRVHPIRQGELQKTSVAAVSSSFESPPYWGQDYLASQRYTLGMPLSAKDGAGGNLILKLPTEWQDEPVVVRVELDDTNVLGWVNLFPGRSPSGIDVPGYGFPGSMRIFRVERRADGKELRFLLPDQELLKNPGNNMLRLRGAGSVANALEFECNDFPAYQGQPVFSLGEIEVIRSGHNLSRDRLVSIRGVEMAEDPGLRSLVDGKVGGRDILHLPEWLRQLAKGKPHEVRLAGLKAEQLMLRERWGRFRAQTLIGGAAAGVVGILGVVLYLLRSRRRAEARLRRQIYSDLHDEVGSNLGSVSLLVEQLAGIARSERMKDGMFNLSLMAREACVSLREVVWVADQKSIRLPALLQKLNERAERVLDDVKFSSEIPGDCPDEVVSLSIKRHLMMFFKEAVHNCARHARATEVRLTIFVFGNELTIELRDNGCGFDGSQPVDGWGLGSMKQRAREMGGEMELHAVPAGGTTVRLRLPLSALSKEPSQPYKTSN
ncbi:sensor histidine kinase [Haloferula chungangensis]|uniref:Sensor histidine kinase n=1 Tax=Haloferula chungangensis TaxID=1048331 RepID=A0ABW2L8W0_9BACT